MSDFSWSMASPEFEGDAECPRYRSWPWHGHRLFGYDLVTNLRPQLIVELGTYWGTSFFSFCQAVKDHDLACRCVAVDTWRGDDHTGGYAEDVFAMVRQVHERHYGGLDIELLRMLFAEARDSFGDDSIDLLHIDGLHTYEAVREDYETWLPKLAPDGVVLFHDIADSCDYGSVRFYKELKEQYPSYTFQHSWGLGVLFPKGETIFQQLERGGFRQLMPIYEYRSEMELARLQVAELTRFNELQDQYLKTLEEQLATAQSTADGLRQRLRQLEGSRAVRLVRAIRRTMGLN